MDWHRRKYNRSSRVLYSGQPFAGAFPIVVHHFRCHILLVTDRCTAAGSIVGTAASAHSASPISAVWTWAAPTVAGDGLFDYLLLDLGARLSGLGGLTPSDAKGQ